MIYISYAVRNSDVNTAALESSNEYYQTNREVRTVEYDVSDALNQRVLLALTLKQSPEHALMVRENLT